MRFLNRTYQKLAPVFLLLFACTLTAEEYDIPQIREIQTDHYARFKSVDNYFRMDPGTIIDIYQDKYGYIWLAGTKCLSRFDGNNMKHYVNDWTPGSLPSSETFCIDSDAYGRLWIGTAAGLCYYDYEKDHFHTLIGGGKNIQPSDSLRIRAIMPDGDSLLWVDDEQGYLRKIDLNSLQVLNIFKHDFIRQPYYYYHDIFRENDTALWVGGRGLGPVVLNESDGSFRLYNNAVGRRIAGKKHQVDMAYMHRDINNNIWVGSVDGIYLYMPQDNSFQVFYQTSSWALHESDNGDLWFATGRGLMKYEPGSGNAIMYESNEEDSESLAGNYLYEVFEDSYGHIWASGSYGLSVLKPDSYSIKYFFHIPGIINTPSSSRITDLFQADSGGVWFSTEQAGVNYLDISSNFIIHYTNQNVHGLPSNNVRCLLQAKGAVYCGLWAGKGFGKLIPHKYRFELYTYNNQNTHFDWYNDLEFDKEGNLYLGFWGGHGLTLFDTIRAEFGRTINPKFLDDFESRLVTNLYFDDQQTLWMGTTRSGLYHYFPKEDTSISYYSALNPQIGFDMQKVFQIAQDEGNTIWVAGKGLYYKTLGRGIFEKLDLGEELAGEEIYGFLLVNQDIWLMMASGLYRYQHRWDRITEYTQDIKLNFSENNACAIELADGRLMFGGSNGLMLIDVQNLDQRLQRPKVFISELQVFDKEKFQAIANDASVMLNYDENFFTIQLGSDVWGEEDPFHYSYKLVGFNEEWVNLRADDRVARFTNVPPGTYRFRTRVEDNRDNIYYDLASFTLIIPAPFYTRWWFIAFIILIILAGISWLWYNRYSNLKLNLSNAELNQKLLRLQMNPHFIFNSLFAIQNYIYSNQTHLAGNYLSDFAHLIRMILDNSRHEYITFEKELDCIDLYLKLQQLRFEEQFEYNIRSSIELREENYMIPPMLAQPFLENAIEHGLKNLNRKGKIDINYELTDKYIRFAVSDNGIGLTASRKIKEQETKTHESLAIKIVNERLRILNQKKGLDILFNIKEIIEGDEVKGTEVTFNIPYQ